MALEVHAGGGAAGHDHRDQRDPHGLAQGQPEAEGQQRDDEDAAAESEQGAEQAGDGAAADHEETDDHLSGGSAGSEAGRPGRSASRIRGGGAVGRTAGARRGGRA